jgi:hypothetical protein
MKTRTVALGVFTVVALAVVFGAPGLFGSDAPDSDPNVTPTPTERSMHGAPGVGTETLENVTALLEAYRGSMTNVGFVAEANATGSRTVYTYARGGSRLVEAASGSRVIWTNGTASLMRDASGDNVTYRRPSEVSLSTDTLTRYNRFEALLAAARYERDGTTPCGDTTCVVLTAEGSPGGPFENFTATAHVDETGVIHRFDAEYVRTTDDKQFDLAFSVTRIGVESIDRPDWVDEGLESVE